MEGSKKAGRRISSPDSAHSLQSAPPQSREAQTSLAERYAPILVLWPEVPARRDAALSLRSEYSRPSHRLASQARSGAHLVRDFHPCDVRLVLEHSQVWEPTPPLPLIPAWFPRAYRDFARFFFWPFLALVVVSLLILALAQGLPDLARRSIEIGVLVALGTVYLLMVRSPILAPLNNWHHLNHTVLGLGVVVAWGAIFGNRQLWILAPVIAIPTLLSFLTGIAMRLATSLTHAALGLLQKSRDFLLRRVARQKPDRTERHTSRLFHGLKAPHEYSSQAELFFRDPETRKPIHYSDRAAHWSAYSRIHAGEKWSPVFYARVLDPDREGREVIQYWFFYYYNDWANEHEGDWETASVFLENGRPVAMACSQHERGERRDWAHVERRGERPILHVAAGSHALYFEPGAYLSERPIAGLQFTALDATLLGREVLEFVDFTPGDPSQGAVLEAVDVVLIPDPDPVTGRWEHLDHDPLCLGGCRLDFEWLNFPGHWGAAAVSLNVGRSGPRGPVFSGLRWDDPRLWAATMCRSCRVCEGDERPF